MVSLEMVKQYSNGITGNPKTVKSIIAEHLHCYRVLTICVVTERWPFALLPRADPLRCYLELTICVITKRLPFTLLTNTDHLCFYIFLICLFLGCSLLSIPQGRVKYYEHSIKLSNWHKDTNLNVRLKYFLEKLFSSTN